MKTRILTVLILLSVAFTADARARKSKKHKVKSSSKTSLTMLTMSRTACFGRCPTYDIVVYSNGIVEYRGKRFTAHDGVYQKNVGKAATDVLAAFAAKRIDTCKAVYDKTIADLPGIWYAYTLNGKSGQVGNAESGPMWLKTMSLEVDELGKVDNSWKKISDKVPE